MAVGLVGLVRLVKLVKLVKLVGADDLTAGRNVLCGSCACTGRMRSGLFPS